jgi:membrane protein YqaA with SNARE-associated domain
MSVAIGSSIGAMFLVTLVEIQGLPWILEIFPDITTMNTWIYTSRFFKEYGLYLIFFVGVTPFSQQPALILASLADSPLNKVAIVVFMSRVIKFFIMAYVATHAPKLLSKLWGLQDELQEVGLVKNSKE